jgi:hypothetical protein
MGGPALPGFENLPRHLRGFGATGIPIASEVVNDPASKDGLRDETRRLNVQKWK